MDCTIVRKHEIWQLILPFRLLFFCQCFQHIDQTTLINSDLQGGEEGIVTNNNGTNMVIGSNNAKGGMEFNYDMDCIGGGAQTL